MYPIAMMEIWQENHQNVEEKLCDIFIRNAIDNRGVLTSPRRASEVVSRIMTLFKAFMLAEATEDDVIKVAETLAEQGLAFASSARLLHGLTDAVCKSDVYGEMITAVMPQLTQFQFMFLEKLTNAHELNQLRFQESSQLALQLALQKQLERQRKSHAIQTQRTHDLNQILQLNAHLALIADVQTLLVEAVEGICSALQLANASVYQCPLIDGNWILRSTSAAEILDVTDVLKNQLNVTQSTGEDVVRYATNNDDQEQLIISTHLQVGNESFGAMLIMVDELERYDQEALLILIRTFAQNLAALWHNLDLLEESEQRTREMEILHGRFVDNIWQEENELLQAEYYSNQLHINPDRVSADVISTEMMPLQIGEYTFGRINLPDTPPLSFKDAEFVQAIIREMGTALNNAHLLQTTRAYSNQLGVAEEVSRAATTILDHEQLISEVVTLIRDGFDFYYVGLFLLDEATQTAVLRAGTGKAGQIQLANNHFQPLGAGSMIGAAIADGEARIEQDITAAKDFYVNPILPDTQSESAIPLRIRNRTIGALTVQSKDKYVFSHTTVTVLQSLADQLTIAIENATLFDKIQQNLAETNRFYAVGQQINAAATQTELYQILVNFIGDANLADIVQIIVDDPSNPEQMLIPASWATDNANFTPVTHISRQIERLFTKQQLALQKKPVFIQNKQQISQIDQFLSQQEGIVGISGLTLIPLLHREDESLGTMLLIFTDSTPPSAQKLQPYLTVIEQGSIILANQQLLNQTQAMYQVGRDITQAITRDDALDIAVREVMAYTGAVQCRIVLYDKQLGVGQISSMAGSASIANDVHIINVRLSMQGDFVYDSLSQLYEPLILTEASDHVPLETIQQHLHAFGAKSSLLLPLASQQELIGFMAIDSVQSKRPFKPSNIIFAQTIIGHLTTQIENIKLLDEALNRAQELITLNQIQSNISSVLNLTDLANTVYQQVGRLLDNTIFILAQYEAETSTYTPIQIRHEGKEIQSESHILLPSDQIYHFLEIGQHLIIDQHHPLMQMNIHPHPLQQPQTSLWVPLYQERRPIGLISVQSFSKHAYDNNDIELLRSIAIQTSLTIANAQLFTKIQATNKELRQLDKVKTQFLASMSHELRTPLNSIIGFSRVILKGIDGPITETQQEDLTSIHSNGQHLLALINEILDMAKIGAGKMTLAMETVDLIEIAKTASTTISSLIKEKEHPIEFIWNVSAKTLPIEADPVRVRQILHNVLSNAVKYTEIGSIQLSINQKDDQVHIFVADTGIGIALEDYAKVFTAFEQVDNSTTRASGGTGLGLPITKWIVTMHQGKIWYESTLNQGTTFHVTLPLKQNQQSDSHSTNQMGPTIKQP